MVASATRTDRYAKSEATLVLARYARKYGPDFAKGYRSDTKLETVREDTGKSLSEAGQKDVAPGVAYRSTASRFRWQAGACPPIHATRVAESECFIQDYTIERVGRPDLVFNGELIGRSAGDKPHIKIYRTKAGKFIGEMAVGAERASAEHFDKPLDLVAWLRRGSSSLTEEAQAAVEDAVKNDASFKSFSTERFE